MAQYTQQQQQQTFDAYTGVLDAKYDPVLRFASKLREEVQATIARGRVDYAQTSLYTWCALNIARWLQLSSVQAATETKSLAGTVALCGEPPVFLLPVSRTTRRSLGPEIAEHLFLLARSTCNSAVEYWQLAVAEITELVQYQRAGQRHQINESRERVKKGLTDHLRTSEERLIEVRDMIVHLCVHLGWNRAQRLPACAEYLTQLRTWKETTHVCARVTALIRSGLLDFLHRPLNPLQRFTLLTMCKSLHRAQLVLTKLAPQHQSMRSTMRCSFTGFQLGAQQTRDLHGLVSCFYFMSIGELYPAALCIGGLSHVNPFLNKVYLSLLADCRYLPRHRLADTKQLPQSEAVFVHKTDIDFLPISWLEQDTCPSQFLSVEELIVFATGSDTHSEANDDDDDDDEDATQDAQLP